MIILLLLLAIDALATVVHSQEYAKQPSPTSAPPPPPRIYTVGLDGKQIVNNVLLGIEGLFTFTAAALLLIFIWNFTRALDCCLRRSGSTHRSQPLSLYKQRYAIRKQE